MATILNCYSGICHIGFVREFDIYIQIFGHRIPLLGKQNGLKQYRSEQDDYPIHKWLQLINGFIHDPKTIPGSIFGRWGLRHLIEIFQKRRGT